MASVSSWPVAGRITASVCPSASKVIAVPREAAAEALHDHRGEPAETIRKAEPIPAAMKMVCQICAARS